MGLWFRRNIRARHLIVFAVAASMSFSAFLLPSPGVDAQGTGNVLRIGLSERPSSLNPFIGLTDLDRALAGMLYDCLQSVDENLGPAPNLALSWWMVPVTDPAMIVSGEPYGSVWEYNITSNANWSDGEPFGPEDVVFTIDVTCSPANFSTMWSYQPYTYYISHAEIVDADTVRIHFFDRATGDPLPVAFGDQLYIPILPKHKLEGFTASYIGWTWTGVFDGEDMPVVGTGPFMATPGILAEFETGDNLTLLTNPDYHWALDFGLSVRFDELSLGFYADDAAVDAALRAGEIDAAKFGDRATYLSLKQDVSSGDAPNIFAFDDLKCTQEFTKIAFNMDPYSLGNPSRCDPAVRTALAMATNKDNITEDYYLGLSEPGTTIVSPVSGSWYLSLSPAEQMGYNLDSASTLLESAGYRYLDEGAEFRVATADSLAVQEGWVSEGTVLQFDLMVREDRPEEQQTAALLEAEWASIGVDVVPRYLNESELSVELYMYSYDLALWFSRSDPDPQHILFTQSVASWNGWSDNLYSNASFETSYSSSVSALNRGQRMTFVDECQMTFYDDVGYIVLAYPYQTYAWRTDTFDGWGEWSSHPGRSLDACWGANPLFFDLVPADLNSPPINLVLSADPEIAFIGDVVTFNAAAADVDMEALTFTLDFGDGTLAVNSSKEGSWEPQHVYFTHEYAENGTFDLTLWADDGSGIDGHNVSKTFLAKVVIGDLFAPVTDASVSGVAGQEGWYLSNVTVTLSATDNLTGVAYTMYRLGSGEWEVYDSPFIVSIQGQATLEYYSVDFGGMVEVHKFEAFKIDTHAPAVAPDLASGSVLADSDVLIQWTCEDNVSGYDRSTYSLDWSAFVDADQVVVDGEDGAQATFAGLPDGEHTLVIRVYDVAGNVAETTVDFEVSTSQHSWLAYVGIGSVAVLIVLMVALLLMRKRGKPSPAGP